MVVPNPAFVPGDSTTSARDGATIVDHSTHDGTTSSSITSRVGAIPAMYTARASTDGDNKFSSDEAWLRDKNADSVLL
jgi:hypothetical protein